MANSGIQLYYYQGFIEPPKAVRGHVMVIVRM